MDLRQISIVLAGEHLAGISPDMDPADAANLLAIWTALWHPQLLTRTRSMPVCRSADSYPSPADLLPGELACIPAITLLPEEATWLQGEAAAPDFRQFESRAEVISQLSQTLGVELDSPLADEFYALGYAYLQVEMLTRSMSYDPIIDQKVLDTAVAAAADAAVAGDEETLDRHLDDSYDVLMQARNHYYPVDPHLINLWLLASTTVGGKFEQECLTATSASVLVTGDLLDHMAQQHPSSLAALRDAVGEGRITVCGGSYTSKPLAAMSPEVLLGELRSGQLKVEQHLGRRPNVFAHPDGPVAPLAAGVLQKLGYHSTLLCNFSGQALPASASTRTAWTALDNSYLEALNSKPIDAGNSSALLGLSSMVSRAMSYDSSATLLVAGWAGHRSDWYNDLMRVARRSSVLGRPTTMENYFDVTAASDHAAPMPAEEFRLHTSDTNGLGAEAPEAKKPNDSSIDTEGISRHSALVALAEFASHGKVEAGDPALTLTHALGGDPTSSEGTLTLNSSSRSLTDRQPSTPAFGWSWAPNGTPLQGPPRAESGVLRNEHLEIKFDDRTGGVSAARLHGVRGNLLSQQPRLQGNADDQLAFDGWEVLEASDNQGRLASNYRIVDRAGNALANVRQVATLAANSRALDLDFEFETGDSAKQASQLASHQLVSRIAYRDAGARLTRGLQGVDIPTRETRFVAAWLGIRTSPPLAVICSEPHRHWHHQERMIDTQLTQAGSEPRRVRLSYVFDCSHPAVFANALHDSRQLATLPCGSPTQPHGWWLRLGAVGLLVTHLSAEPQGEHGLLRLRILETTGRQVSTTLAAWRPFVDAQAVNFHNEPEQLLHLRDGEVQLNFAPYEWMEVLAAW